MSVEVQTLAGKVEIIGTDQAVASLLKVGATYDAVAASSTAALRQINNFGTAQGTQTAATGINSLSSANQKLTQSTAGLAAAERQRLTLAAQIASLEQRVAAAQTDAAGRVQLYTQAMASATAGSTAYLQAQLKMLAAQKEVTREQQNTAQAVAGGVGRGVLQGIGAGGVLGGLGIAGGIAIATREMVNLGQASTDLAIKAETIGTAYEGATKRAGFAADDFIKKLNDAARGTVDTADLEMSANKALALGVGQNAQQVADLLAIARQKGKDFGEGTNQAFSDIVTGLGRLSPRILDNLGIILSENEIYKKYADAIGVAEGKLSDQEKRQALVNELLRTNTDLITKNASAQLDSADKIARSQATIQEAETRAGKIILPVVAGAADTGATFLESITGGISARADALNRQLAAQATSAQDYVNKYNAAIKQLNPGGTTQAGTTDELTGQYLALTKLSAAQVDQIRINAQSDAGRSESIHSYQESTRAIIENTQATDLSKDDLDRIGASLATATDQGLRPYKAAVDEASDALKAHQASEKAAKDSVDAISGSLTEAKAKFQEFASARLVEDQKYQTGLAALDLQQEAAQKRLLEFKAPGAGLDQIINPIQSQIDAADASLKGYASDLDEINSFVEDQTQTVKDAEEAQKGYDRTLSDSKTNLASQQSRLDALTGVYDKYTRSIQDAKRAQDDLRRTPIVGEGALDDKLFNMEENVKKAELRLAQAQASGAGKGTLKDLQATVDSLNKSLDIARLQGDLAFDAQKRQIAQAGIPRNEKTAADILAGISQQQSAIDGLTASQNDAAAAVASQQKVVDDAKWDLLDATGAQRLNNEQVDLAKAALDKLKDSQTAVQKQYSDQKTLLGDLKQKYTDLKDAALKPYQDKIDEIGRQAEVLKLAEKMEIDPLKQKIADLTTTSKVMTFKEITDGLHNVNDIIAILEPRLAGAKNILKGEQDATKAAQVTYDAATTALTAEQKYFDALKVGLDDMKTKLTESKDIWGDLSTLIAAINAANAGGIPGAKAPFYGGTGSGPNANAINKILQGTGLEGQGSTIAQLAKQYNVPVELALAMFRKESSYGTYGSSVGNRNPGNLRGSPLESGERSGFAVFKDIQTGIEAYFKLLSENYRQFIDKGDIAGLINKYAPPSENDTALYIKQIIEWMTQLTSTLRATATGMGPLDAGEAALGIPGSQVTTQFSASHQGIDLAGAAEGSPIHALQGGKVILSQWSDMYGNMVEIANAQTGKIEEYYGHLAERLVKVGDLVTQGTIIGTLGGTGSAATGVHLHLQMYDENGQVIDPMTALAKLFGTGQGPSAEDLATLLQYVSAMEKAGAGMSIAGPNMDTLAGSIAGVGDAAAAAAAGIDDASTAIVNATNDILDHINYAKRGGLPPGMGYNGATGGMPGYNGPPDHFAFNKPDKQANDPTWGQPIAATAADATKATKAIKDLVAPWSASWDKLHVVAATAMDDTETAVRDGGERVLRNIHRISDELTALLNTAQSLSTTSGGHRNSPGAPGGTDPIKFNNITINTRDGDRVVRLLRQRGY